MTHYIVKAHHPHWVGALSLSKTDNHVRHVGHKSEGKYFFSGNKLTVEWNDYKPDVFFRHPSGIFVHESIKPHSINFFNDLRIGQDVICVNSIGVPVGDGSYEVNIRLRTSDAPTFEQVFLKKEYDSPNLPETAHTIVDLGANVGYATVFFGLRYPKARLLSVEPEPGNYAALVKNTRALGDRVTTEQSAIWIDDGIINLHTEDDDGTPLGEWGIQVSQRSTGGSTPVKSRRLATLLESHGMDRVNILKIDIEGAELEVFSEDCSGWLSKVDMVIIETHDRFRAGSEGAARAALRHAFDELPRLGENLYFRRKTLGATAQLQSAEACV